MFGKGTGGVDSSCQSLVVCSQAFQAATALSLTSCLIVTDQNDILLPAVLSLRQNPPHRLWMRPLLLPLLDHESSDIRANDTGHINARRQLVHCSRVPQVFFQLDLTEFASWD
jgi:hypothetical protein